jgi:hypothetical protein
MRGAKASRILLLGPRVRPHEREISILFSEFCAETHIGAVGRTAFMHAAAHGARHEAVEAIAIALTHDIEARPMASGG